MTLQSSGQIAISDVSTELGLGPTYSSSLGFLNGYLKSPASPPNMTAFYGTTYYQNNTAGNCNNGNCSNNCNCGNIGDANCFIIGNVNCANCDGQAYLQANCNCACTYNCANCSGGSHNCNCACDCSKIVCAKLYDMGLMSSNIWAADQAYGRWLREHDRRVYRGYIRWARIVTAWMDGRGPAFMYWVSKDQRNERQQKLMTRVAYNIGTPWSQHMAYLMGALPEDNLQGRILMKIGTTISRLVDRLPRRPKSKIKHGPLTVGTMWLCLYGSYYTSVVLTKAITFFNKKSNTNLVQETSK
jgi:hypothetical protein